MNILTVDGNNLTAKEITGANLEEILMNLMDHPSVNNRIITKVLVNGDSYSEEVPHAALEVERTTIESLELVTKSAEDLSLHFMENGHYFVDMLRKALPKIVEEFRMGDEVEANEHFLSFLESLHLVINMMEQTKVSMGLGDDIEVADKGSINNFMEKLSSTLSNLISIQEQSDWIYLADILEYELDNALCDLIDILPLMKKAGH
ncbi:hypothetical protein C4J81_13065 [Deltaproteobacteria bacterium Smac51]|nr:hypothetical protein C4J81_13065 [Deltaproteobacteria bacterium Smac51]